jgi:hypothetical protein
MSLVFDTCHYCSYFQSLSLFKSLPVPTCQCQCHARYLCQCFTDKDSMSLCRLWSLITLLDTSCDFVWQVIYKTLNPQWNQTLEFPDDGSPLILYVKDHNALLPTSSIGECVVEYQRLPPNQMADKWIPLQSVKRGEIHIQITRKVPEMQKRNSIDSEPSLTKLHQIPSQVRSSLMSENTSFYYIFCVVIRLKR